VKIGPFESLRALLGCYRYMKADVEGAKAVLPKPDMNQTDNYQIFASRAALQDKHCFIADVENCCKWYIEQRFSRYGKVPADCVSEVFIGRYGFPKKSFGELAIRFRARMSRGDRLPKLLLDARNVRKLALHIRDNVDGYFKQKEYIE